MPSPTQRTRSKLREEGYLTEIVERWNPHARVRHDLFGIIDVLAVRGEETLAVQCTSGSGVAARVHKLKDSDSLPVLLAAGWQVQVWGWRKIKVKRGGKAMKWECRCVDLTS